MRRRPTRRETAAADPRTRTPAPVRGWNFDATTPGPNIFQLAPGLQAAPSQKEAPWETAQAAAQEQGAEQKPEAKEPDAMVVEQEEKGRRGGGRRRQEAIRRAPPKCQGQDGQSAEAEESQRDH